jgi:uncharacterized protein (DUF736 family)
MSGRQYETKDGEGALFKNDRKESEQHPDYNGNLRLNGQDYWVSAWIKSSKAGKKYMSLSLRPKQVQEHRGATRNPPPQTSPADDFNDDVPF